MKRTFTIALLAAALVAAFSFPALPQVSGLGLVLHEYKQGTVTSTDTTERAYNVYTSGIYIKNDGDVDIAVRFGLGNVDTSTGAGGGIVKAHEGIWFPQKTQRVALKTASGSAAYRLWAWRQA